MTAALCGRAAIGARGAVDRPSTGPQLLRYGVDAGAVSHPLEQPAPVGELGVAGCRRLPLQRHVACDAVRSDPAPHPRLTDLVALGDGPHWHAGPVVGEHRLEVDAGCLALGRQRDAGATQTVPDGALGDVQLGGDGADAGAGLDALQQVSGVVDVGHRC